MTFLGDLLELAPHTLLAQPGYLTGTGSFVPSGAIIPIPCNIEGTSDLVRDNQTGRDVVPSHMAICLEFNGLTVDAHRYQIPSEFPDPVGFLPSGGLVALRVDPASDEEGTLYEIVFFP